METANTDRPNHEGRQYWEEAWKITGNIQLFSPHTAIIEESKWGYLIERLPCQRDRALEVGCGSGHFGALLAQAGFETILLDYTSSALTCARESFAFYGGRWRKSFVRGDAFHLPFATESIDVVVSCGLLEHFENPIGVIREMVRVLRRGGLFYADIVPKKFSLIRLVENLHSKPSGWYEAMLRKEEILDLMKKSGAADIQVFSAGVLPPRSLPGTGRIAFLRQLECFLLRRFKRFWKSLDGTRIADSLGFYYLVTAYKA